MQVEKAIAKLKATGHDISDEYSTDDCIGFLNTAVQEICHQLATGKSPQMVKEITLHDSESLPVDYIISCGNYPIKTTGQTVTFVDPSVDTLRFRYFATKPQIMDATGDMPFVHEVLNDITVRLATLFALKQNEYDVSQDKALLDEVRQAVAQGMGG